MKAQSRRLISSSIMVCVGESGEWRCPTARLALPWFRTMHVWLSSGVCKMDGGEEDASRCVVPTWFHSCGDANVKTMCAMNMTNNR